MPDGSVRIYREPVEIREVLRKMEEAAAREKAADSEPPPEPAGSGAGLEGETH
jgi:hypothetical protein